MNRPVFNDKMTSETFHRFYWYKAELEKICRTYKLPSYGTKAELADYIHQYLEGVPASEIKSVRKIRRQSSKNLKADQITLETKLLNSGFSLNNEARIFFCHYFQVEKFSFRKSMGIMMREAEKNGDTEATVYDLIQCLNNEEISDKNNEEEKTYQWNNFVRDFRKDEDNSKFHSQMKVAAILWKILKTSAEEKIYTRELVEEHLDVIKEYLK